MRSDVWCHVTGLLYVQFGFDDDDDDDDVVVIQAPFYTLTGDFLQKIFTVVDTTAISQGAKHTHLAMRAIIKGFRGL